ncbi:hypothetical protein DRQ07_11830 [candidate division KSB1 bacterium]|nr:MAG: hypothetical protein DRQ07_11830 [candidate division KSB1 bacterium]
MAFKKNYEKKSLSLPGMIDIIFLLLIFALVTLSTSQSGVDTKKRGAQHDRFQLPNIGQAETFESDQVLRTLLFQVEYVDSTNQKRLLVLWPDVKDSLTLNDARINALMDWDESMKNKMNPKSAALIPSDYLSLGKKDFEKTWLCSLIRNSIKKYTEDNFFQPSLSNRIEIRAVKDTEFRLVNYIMTECGKYDKLIPRCVFRTVVE